MTALLTVIHVVICVLLIIAVLLQSGKGGGLAASVGGGLSFICTHMVTPMISGQTPTCRNGPMIGTMVGS